MIHLPECWLSEGKFDAVCICDRLRACEQRVLDAAREAVEGVQRWHEFSWGLDDDDHGEYMKAEDALGAIDALREEPPIANT